MSAAVSGGGRRPVVPSAVLGVVIVIIIEAMFFSGLISAFQIGRTVVGPAAWPRPSLEAMVVSAAVILASASALFRATRAFRRDPRSAIRPLAVSIALGAFFLLVQGRGWLASTSDGLAFSSSTHRAFFWLLVGSHGAHVAAAVGIMAWALSRLRAGRLAQDVFTAVSLFWYFVAAVWPVLVYVIYLL